MSSDQRPGKVRVFSSNAAATATPTRRRGDPPPATVPAAEPDASAREDAARPDRTMLLAVLFLLGCAIGGAVIAWLKLIPGAPS